MEDKQEILCVQAHGRFVYKAHICEVLNLRSKKQWYQEIELLSETVEGFAELYEDYRYKNTVSVKIARVILETIIEQFGDNTKVKFVFNTPIRSAGRKRKDWKCEVCQKPLTDEEKDTVSKNDYTLTCREHREYKNYFNLAKVRSQLGY